MALLAKVVSSGAAELAIGSMLADRFRIERVLGFGGMGTVYGARDRQLARDVAIKLHNEGAGGARLAREAVAMAQLAHPNVVTVFETGVVDGRTFVVMEYVPGATLRTWAGARRRAWREVLAMVIGAGEGLAAAHDAGLVHRDVKPENVLVGDDGRPRVGDFGLARVGDSQDDEPAPQPRSDAQVLAAMTQTGAAAGTPAYMAPEQFAGGAVDARVDQFAFCVTAWEMLYGERPFAGTTLAEVARAIVAGERRPPPPGARIPKPIRAALERGLSKDRDARFADMHALLATLRRASKRRRGVWIAAGGGVAITAAAIAYVAWPASPSCGDPPRETIARDYADRLRAANKPELAKIVDRMTATLDRDYDKLARGACERSRVTHDWSDEIARRSVACLRIAMATARRQLADAPDPAQASKERVQLQLAWLPSLGPCADATYLGALPAPPEDPARLDALIEARAELSAAIIEVDAYDRAVVVQHLARLDASPARDDRGIAAGIAFVRGLLATHDNDVASGVKQIADAYYAARAIDDDDLAASALGQLVTISVEMQHDRAAAKQWLRTALADAERTATRTPWLSAQLYIHAARVGSPGTELEFAL